METVSLRAMNTDVLLAAEGQTEMLAVGFEQARRFIHSSEARFTRFSEESELSALNRSAGQPGVFTARPEIARRPNDRMPPGRNPVATWNVPGQVDTKSAGQRFQASPDLFEVVRLASRFFHLTRGLFDPSILPDLKRVGYDRSMEVLREQGPAPLLESLLEGERPSFSEMDLDESDQTILLPPGLALDLGGIAKGWIAEQAALILSKYSSACVVDAGGDMFMVGLPNGLDHWLVELEDPFDVARSLTSLRLGPGAIATSTVTKRAWSQTGRSRHHIIDPRTGEPAVSDWVSVTVIAPHACEAEVFAKALLIAGPPEAEGIVGRSGIPLTYLAVDREKNIQGTQPLLEKNYVDTAAKPA